MVGYFVEHALDYGKRNGLLHQYICGRDIKINK